MSWWNTSYLFRRRIQTTTLDSVPAAHPVSINLSTQLSSMGKVRNDYADIVAVYYDGTNSYPLPTMASLNSGNIQVDFDLYAALPSNQTNTGQYYVYYGNQFLSNVPTLASYTSNPWPLSVSANELGITYTSPGEDWENGVTTKHNARAAFAFSGVGAELVADIGPNYGIVNIQLDNGPWKETTLFSPRAQTNQVIYSVTSLAPMDHIIRVVNLKKKTPGSSGTKVNIVQFNYMKYVGTQDLGEDIVPLDWSAAIGGTK